MRPQSETVVAALARLRAAADRVASAWPDMEWSGPKAAKPLVLTRGEFTDLVVEPGAVMELTSPLRLPRRLEGIELAGEPIDVMVDSIYPIELEHDGAAIFHDANPAVAPGPALVRAVSGLQPENNGKLTLRVKSHDYKTWPWLRLRFTTPKLQKRFELLDVAWSQLALASEVAASPREKAAVEKAAAIVMKAKLEGADLPVRLDAAGAALEAVSTRVRDLRVHVIGHSHIDMNWLWTWPDTLEVIRRDFATILDLMDEFPEMTFTHSQAATYEVIRKHAPSLFSRVREYVAAGRWELATMQWVESDLNMVSGESLAQHLTHAVSYSREHFGRRPSVFLAPDTFGHAGNVPQLARSAGARSYYHHRCNPGGHDLWPAYWWEGDDGSRILALSTPSYNGLITAAGVAAAALRAHRNGLDSALLFHGIGDHGGGPTRQGLEALRRFATLPCLPDARCSTLTAHTKEVVASRVRLPVHRGELNTIFEGCYTTHVDAKSRNRRAENLLSTAQTLAALAAVDEREKIGEAWRGVMFNQFHDIFCGSSIHEAYEQNMRDLAEADATASAVIDGALSALTAVSAAGRVAVTNPLGWEREEVVVVPAVRTRRQESVRLVTPRGIATPGQWTSEGLAFLARVPAFDTADYAVRPDAKPPAAIAVTEDPLYLAIETETFAARIHRPSAAIVSLRDKREGRELVGFGLRRGSDYFDLARIDLALNVLQLLEERFHPMSAWHLDDVASEISLVDGAVTEVIETGPVRAVVKATRTFRHSQIEQRIVFYKQVGRIDFETLIDWQEVGGPEQGIPNLKVAFNGRLLGTEAWFEAPYGATRRPADGQEVPALRWAGVGGDAYGLSLLNDGRYGHDALGSRLRLTLVRSAVDPDPISDVGRHSVRYSLVPHRGDWREADIPRLSAGFNQPLIARHGRKRVAPRRSSSRPVVTGSPGVMISTLKQAHEGSGLVLRLNEGFGRKGEAVVGGLPAGWRADRAAITEEPLARLPVRGGRFRVRMRPWEVVTVLLAPGPRRA